MLGSYPIPEYETTDYVLMLLRSIGPCTEGQIASEIFRQDIRANNNNYKELTRTAIEALLRTGQIVVDEPLERNTTIYYDSVL